MRDLAVLAILCYVSSDSSYLVSFLRFIEIIFAFLLVSCICALMCIELWDFFSFFVSSTMPSEGSGVRAFLGMLRDWCSLCILASLSILCASGLIRLDGMVFLLCLFMFLCLIRRGELGVRFRWWIVYIFWHKSDLNIQGWWLDFFIIKRFHELSLP